MALILVLGLSLLTVSYADDLERILSIFGRPDEVDSTEYDRPRPPIVTKWITYKKQGVSIYFIPNAKVGDPPPYMEWKLFGCIDNITKKPLTFEETKRRFGK
jgi:hypothetical protein